MEAGGGGLEVAVLEEKVRLGSGGAADAAFPLTGLLELTVQGLSADPLELTGLCTEGGDDLTDTEFPPLLEDLPNTVLGRGGAADEEIFCRKHQNTTLLSCENANKSSKLIINLKYTKQHLV